MKSVSGREFARLLEKKGWQLKRIKGSHHVYVKSGNPRTNFCADSWEPTTQKRLAQASYETR